MTIMRLGDKPLRSIVLAGGRSRRFGSDKAMARIGGTSMLEKAVRTLREFDSEPVIITRPDAEYHFEKCRVERDLIPDCGPLGGLYTAFRLFEGHVLLVMTCDTPRVSVELLRSLLIAYHPSLDSVHFEGPHGRTEPFPSLYDSSLIKLSETYVRSGRLSMRSFISAIPRSNILKDKEFQTELININFQADLDRLSARNTDVVN